MNDSPVLEPGERAQLSHELRARTPHGADLDHDILSMPCALVHDPLCTLHDAALQLDVLTSELLVAENRAEVVVVRVARGRAREHRAAGQAPAQRLWSKRDAGAGRPRGQDRARAVHGLRRKPRACESRTLR